jgi:hypothetical protein
VPIRDTGVTSLSGKVYNGTVHVAILARVYGPFPDDVESAGKMEAGASAASAPRSPLTRAGPSSWPARTRPTR